MGFLIVIGLIGCIASYEVLRDNMECQNAFELRFGLWMILVMCILTGVVALFVYMGWANPFHYEPGY